ncbi:MAG: helix-turn-helix transcriptional regulator [Pseudomonadota bacterium]
MIERIGELAREARKGRNYTQTDVRKLLGWDKSRLSRIENGEQEATISDYMHFAVLFSQEFSVKTVEYLAELKAEIYARLCDLLDMENGEINPDSFKRLDNLKALKIDLEALHGAA